MELAVTVVPSMSAAIQQMQTGQELVKKTCFCSSVVYGVLYQSTFLCRCGSFTVPLARVEQHGSLVLVSHYIRGLGNRRI